MRRLRAEVETIDDSDLYLRYVIGEIDPETLHSSQERHLRCNPTLAQFIVADGFEPVVVEGYFGKAQLDPDSSPPRKLGSPGAIAGSRSCPRSA